MTGTTEFIIGTEVSCTDGACGELRRVVVDPVARPLPTSSSSRNMG